MKENPVADKVFATIGAVLWSVQVVPQIVKAYRTKSTEGLSSTLMFIWAMATIFQGSYLVSMRSSIPLQVQPQAFGGFSVLCWGQCLYYGHKWPRWKALVAVALFLAFFAGFEAGSVYALWAGERRGVTWPMEMYGWITSALFAIGLFPQYYEIYKRREVVGISILFMLVDISGGVFSGISLFFRKEFDKTAFVQYFLVVVLDGIVVVLKPILAVAARRRRRRRQLSGDPAIDEENLDDEAPAAGRFVDQKPGDAEITVRGYGDGDDGGDNAVTPTDTVDTDTVVGVGSADVGGGDGEKPESKAKSRGPFWGLFRRSHAPAGSAA